MIQQIGNKEEIFIKNERRNILVDYVNVLFISTLIYIMDKNVEFLDVSIYLSAAHCI